MNKLRASAVFVPGGMPLHTYIPRNARNLEQGLFAASDNLCKLVTVTGSTKSGKTVLTGKVYPKGENIWIDGGTIRQEDDLWNYILEALDGFTEMSLGHSKQTGTSLGGDVNATIGLPLFAQAETSLNANATSEKGTNETRSRSMSPRAAAISHLKTARQALIIDDFHYLERAFQGNVVRALKPLVFDGIPIILIAIPHRKYDAIKVEREMTGRLETIAIPTWEEDELLLICKGFPLLNMEVSRNVSVRFANEAYGSPHLMQEFCRELARVHNVTETQDTPLPVNAVSDDLFRKVARGTGKVIFDRLAAGPRQRTERIDRKLKDGATVDIYGVVLLALAHLAPGLETIPYTRLRGAIKDITSENQPEGHEVSRVLDQMSKIATADEASTPVLDWDRNEQKLHITDPFFAFFLKWGIDEAKKSGVLER